MRDVLRLRHAIHRAIFLAPLAVPAIATLGACAKDDPAKTATVNVPASGSVSPLASSQGAGAADASDAPVVAMPEGGPIGLRNPGMLPRCPSGAFCSTKAKIATFADKTAKKTLDCPTAMEERDRPDAIEGMPRMRFSRVSFDEATTTSTRGDGGASDACCYTWFIPCPGGRPLLSDQAPVVASVQEGVAWSRTQLLIDAQLTEDQKSAAREAWLADALSEHASIASFARNTLELLSVGAPPELVTDCQRAGMDEVRHASLCFELARALGGTAVSPGPLPLVAPRAPDKARLARDTFIEGCVGETVSALAATRAADETQGAVRSTWRLLAADETRHAALAWRTLAWTMRDSGPELGAELLALAERMRDELLDEADAQARRTGADLAAYGRLSPRALSAVHRDAWRDLIMPTLRRMVLGDAPAAS